MINLIVMIEQIIMIDNRRSQLTLSADQIVDRFDRIDNRSKRCLVCLMVSLAANRGIHAPQELQPCGDSCSQMLQREEAAQDPESLGQDSEEVCGGEQLSPVAFGGPPRG